MFISPLPTPTPALALTTQITAPTVSTEAMTIQYDARDRLTRAISLTNGYTGTHLWRDAAIQDRDIAKHPAACAPRV